MKMSTKEDKTKTPQGDSIVSPRKKPELEASKHACKMLEILMAKKVVLAGVVSAVSFLLTAAGFIKNPSPVVLTDKGPVQGRYDYSRDGKQYLAYLGIPYAQPPVGNLRFEPPQPLHKPWNATLQTTGYPPYCLQFDALVRGRLFGQEDCLYLNVFTPGLEENKPVMVYIHGGGFLQGASQMYQPDFLMDYEEIVLVTLNYRLGPLGFMNIEELGIHGNMGLKDQLMALQWVQKNIKNFGGDPNRVTLFGESAGAASVHYHMIAPASKGLFHRAILQSGNFLCPWSFMESPNDVCPKYIEMTNCPLNNSVDLVECLKSMDPTFLVTLQEHLMNPVNDFLVFLPSIESSSSPQPFLTEDPRLLLKEGKVVNKVPTIMGVTSGEGALRTARLDAVPEAIEQIQNNWKNVAPKLLAYESGNSEYDSDVDAIRMFYFQQNDNFAEDLGEFKKNFTKMTSDAFFYDPSSRTARRHTELEIPTHLYYYDYDSVMFPHTYSLFRAVRQDDWLLAEAKLAWAVLVDWARENILRISSPHDYGATHADDLFQLWNMEGLSALFSSPDYTFSKKFVKLFVDFALNKEPLEFDGVKWPSTSHQGSTSELQYMLLAKEPKIIQEPFSDRMTFWRSLTIREMRQ